MSLHVVVVGANRGLGLEFCRQWLDRGHHVHAFARNPGAANELNALASEHSDRMSVGAMDVSDDASVQNAAKEVAANWGHVDVLVNNAGIYGRKGSRLEDLESDEVIQVMQVNTLGPVRATRAMLPLLRMASEPRVANITSLMGSMTDNGSGGVWAYRMSKAALNMASRNMAHELAPKVTVVTMHPGWVKTDMGGPAAPLECADAVSSMTDTIAGLTQNDSGRFIDREGATLPW